MASQRLIVENIFSIAGSAGSSIKGFFTSSAGSTLSSNLPVPQAATGALINSPTLIQAGENFKPEAILPLKRSSKGDLGVVSSGSNVTVQVIDQRSTGNIQTENSTSPNGEQILRLLIKDEVRSNFASGYMDDVMSMYGVRRSGVRR